MFAHLFAQVGHWLASGGWSGGILGFIGYAIGDEGKFRRLVRLLRFLLFVGIVAVAWWWYAHGGAQILVHHFGPPSIPCPRHSPG